MFRDIVVLLLAFVCSPRLIGQCVADELREVDRLLSDLASDLKFGLTEYHCRIEGKVGTSPDSPNWTEGEIRSEHTHLDSGHASKTTWSLHELSNDQDLKKPHSISLRSCFSREFIFENVAYRAVPSFGGGANSETWSPVSMHVTDYSCPNLCPLSWPTALQSDFGVRRKHQIGAFIYRLENMKCIRATTNDKGEIEAITVSSPTTSDGNYLAFKRIILANGLPTSIVDYTFQSGFKGLSDLPPLSRCIVPRSVTLEWAKLKDIPVPSRIMGELYALSPQATGYGTLQFDLKCTFFDVDSKEFKESNAQWEPVIAAIRKANLEEKAKLDAKPEDKAP